MNYFNLAVMLAKVSRYFKSLHLPTVGIIGFFGLAFISGLIFLLCGGGVWWLLGLSFFGISGLIAAFDENDYNRRRKSN